MLTSKADPSVLYRPHAASAGLQHGCWGGDEASLHCDLCTCRRCVLQYPVASSPTSVVCSRRPLCPGNPCCLVSQHSRFCFTPQAIGWAWVPLLVPSPGNSLRGCAGVIAGLISFVQSFGDHCLKLAKVQCLVNCSKYFVHFLLRAGEKRTKMVPAPPSWVEV